MWPAQVESRQSLANGALERELTGGCEKQSRLLRSTVKSLGGPVQVTAVPRGSFSNLVACRLDLKAPGPGQLLLRVRAIGLNFRDVLNVLGMYPGDPGEPGGDVAGTVESVGTGVQGFR